MPSPQPRGWPHSARQEEVSNIRQVVLRAPHAVELIETDGASEMDGLPSTDMALVRLRLAGLCGSDLAAFRGTSPLVSYPRVLGHELL